MHMWTVCIESWCVMYCLSKDALQPNSPTAICFGIQFAGLTKANSDEWFYSVDLIGVLAYTQEYLAHIEAEHRKEKLCNWQTVMFSCRF